MKKTTTLLLALLTYHWASAQIANCQPIDNSLLFYSPDSIVVLPQGSSQFDFMAQNEFGCASEVAENVEFMLDCPGVSHFMEATKASSVPVTLQAMSDLFAGSGIQVTDFGFEGDLEAAGIFKKGSEALCIERGIVLTSGRVDAGNTPAGITNGGTELASWNNLGGSDNDPDFTLLDTSALSTFEEAVFTMQFIPSGDSVSFRYVFASEEYPEWACPPINDVFGLIISGPGINGAFENGGKNIAIIPGTDLPVSMNNVHPQNGACEASFEELYNAHHLSTAQPVYDGILDVLTAGIAVVPCETYTLKLMVADVGDGIFDSAIFMEAESLNSNYHEVADNLPAPTDPIQEGCPTLPLALDFSGLHGSQFPLAVSVSGTATQGVDYLLDGLGSDITQASPGLDLTLNVLEDSQLEPVEFIVLDFTSACGFQFTRRIALTDALAYSLTADTSICAPNSVTLEVTTDQRDSSYVFSSNTPLALPNVGEPHSSAVEVFGLPFDVLFDPSLIQSIKVDITHKWVDDLDLYLRSPSGRYLELSTDNGANCDDYEEVSFSPGALLPINYQFPWGVCGANVLAAFSNGPLRPEGTWEEILGSPINGQWDLVVLDDQLGFTGTLNHWSITFSDAVFHQPNVTWSTGETTPTINISPSTSTTYFVESANGQCNAWLDEVVVSVQGDETLTTISGTHCLSENFSVTVNGTVYDSGNPSGMEVIALPNGCDSVVTVDLTFLPFFETQLEFLRCPGECISEGGLSFCDPGNYVINLQTSAGCDSVVTVHFEQNELALSNVNYDCGFTGFSYIVSFFIQGGDPSSYLVTPPDGVLEGNLFTSNAINSGETYHFTVTSGGCAPVSTAGQVICDCFSSPGTMGSEAILQCGDGPVTAAYNPIGEFLDGNDVLCFVLHTSPTGLGNILASSSAPTFSFLPGLMVYGTTYYITALVGDSDGSGCISFGDPCFIFSNGTPITFGQPGFPDGTASYNAPLCPGDDLQLSASGGSLISWTGPGGFSSNLPNPMIANIPVELDGTYIAVVSNGACSEPDSNLVEVEFACQLAFDTLFNTESDTLCDFHIVSFLNLCDDGEDIVAFTFDTTTACLIYTGTGAFGSDTICLVAVNLLGDTIALHVVVLVQEVLGAGQQDDGHLVEVFPNPASGDFFVKFEGLSLQSLSLYDVTGRFVKEIPLRGSPLNVSVKDLAEGIYFLRFRTEGGVFSWQLAIGSRQ